MVLSRGVVGSGVYFTRTTLAATLRTEQKQARVEIRESSNTWPRAWWELMRNAQRPYRF